MQNGPEGQDRMFRSGLPRSDRVVWDWILGAIPSRLLYLCVQACKNLLFPKCTGCFLGVWSRWL